MAPRRIAIAPWIAVVAMSLATLSTSCGSTSEYAAYRTIRYASDATARASAIDAYLRAYPNGRYASEFLSSTAEERFWATHHTSAQGLYEYLDRFPSGAHRDEARSHLTLLRGVFEAPNAAASEQPSATDPTPGGLMRNWLSVMVALHGWTLPISQFYASNPGFVETFNAPPVASCRPGGCTKFLTASCMLDTGGVRTFERAAFTIRLLARGPQVVGADIVSRHTGASLWRACDAGGTWRPDQDANDSDADWMIEQLRDFAVRIFPNARPTPRAFTGEVLDVSYTEQVPSNPGRVRWSYIVGCNDPFPAQGGSNCIRIDGFDSRTAEGEVGLRLWAIPRAVLEGSRAELALVTSAPSPPIDRSPPVAQVLPPVRVDRSEPLTETNLPAEQPRAERVTAGTRGRNLMSGGVLMLALVQFPADLISLIMLGGGGPPLGLVPVVGMTYYSVQAFSTGSSPFGAVAALAAASEATGIALIVVGASVTRRAARRELHMPDISVAPIPLQGGMGLSLGGRF